ncbi:NADH-quinone oxidoreductase subunit NuoF [Anaerolinea thermophila]|uniref:NADH-quinone oxidoreductase subunit F n=1 Tax=Anaerolinea thermophila (strain DSM 14523 / JCM 11388 / NBRC 100420 / UNI-1) TaxID=926569 RepID=E8N354_ANATU|nr:NADH-quinone oxidoreductase subunit NuoF [Anaerolinea thermophila]BAJ62868.1 NADH-quinone oxidoreductase chain F [Anaerolinea thermophila UNI-1]
MSQYVLLRHREIPHLDQLDVYLKHGGFEAAKKVITQMQPADVVNEVKTSGLRGRGGAGFPTGVKWSFLPNNIWPHYVVCNADESEPGTFKDREILESNPFQLLEGLMIASYAVQANRAYIYLRGEFWQIARKLDEKIAELEKAGLLGDHLFGTNYSLRIYTHLGAGAYICGEETALLESLEGKIGQPRLRPPFPAVYGLYGKPTVINNVETLTNLPPILEKGAQWYRSFGTEKSPGVKIFSLSGNVNRPGNYELPLGTTFRELIYTHGGGIPEGRKVKAILPAGASSAIIAVNDDAILDTPMDYESVAAIGSQLGSASVIVADETVNMAWLVSKTVNFFKHESCGKCTPCREGTFWMNRITQRMMAGRAVESDVDLLANVANQIAGKCLCALGEFSVMAVQTGIRQFRTDFLEQVKQQTAPVAQGD